VNRDETETALAEARTEIARLQRENETLTRAIANGGSFVTRVIFHIGKDSTNSFPCIDVPPEGAFVRLNGKLYMAGKSYYHLTAEDICRTVDVMLTELDWVFLQQEMATP
jgi:hypothetical protein